MQTEVKLAMLTEVSDEVSHKELKLFFSKSLRSIAVNIRNTRSKFPTTKSEKIASNLSIRNLHLNTLVIIVIFYYQRKFIKIKHRRRSFKLDILFLN